MNFGDKRVTTEKAQLIKTFIAGVIVGVVITTIAMYGYYEHNYTRIYYSNIGGFVFNKGRIYNLSELKNI